MPKMGEVTQANIDSSITTHAALTAAHHAKYLDAASVAAVNAAGLALADAKSVKIEETLATDHTWSGLTCDGVAGETLALPEVCYRKSDSKFWKADADAASTMPVIALATAAISAAASGVLLLKGYVRDDTWTWTVGGLIYASVTPGGLSQTAPSESGDQVQVVGVAITADIMYFDPSPVLVEIA